MARCSLTWDDLTRGQMIVLGAALKNDPFISLLHTYTPIDDAPYWNRKRRYAVELTELTLGLLDLGLILIEEICASEELVQLSPNEAREAVANIDNWWIYDADSPEDGVDPFPIDSSTGGGHSRDLYLAATPLGVEISVGKNWMHLTG